MKTVFSHESAPSSPERIAAELYTVCDFVRHGVTMFNTAEIGYGHGTDNAFDEAVFMILETLKLPIDSLEPYWNARLTLTERQKIAGLLHDRVTTRKPASYLLNKAYIQGMPFYVDERVIVPRSFIAEILAKDGGFSQLPDYASVNAVLDLCTGSGCLAILAATVFPNARVDAVDISADAIAVAQKNVADYGLQDRVTLYTGDLFAPVLGKTYDLIITNPPYVDAAGMEYLSAEYKHEPVLALASGEDGLDITRQILGDAGRHLAKGGGLLCEIGRCGPTLDETYPKTPFLWIDTERSSGEVFWLKKQDLSGL